VYNSQKDEWYNTDKDPDFKNKTKCGWINVSNTVKVKNSILELSKLMNKLSEADSIYEASGKTAADIEAFKAVFETYFDVANLIDYFIISDVLYNWDGFSSNWQWITYDGVKWFVNIYDVDCTFGNEAWMNIPGFREPLTAHVSTAYQYHYIIKFYNDELERRYAALRKLNIINAEHITDLIKSWIIRLGNKETFKKEWERWTDVREYDSIFRVNMWLTSSIYNMDTVYNYNEN
jgi:spore coat protein CotH